MKKDEIPFNMEITYSDDLREVPESPDQMRKGLEWLKEKIPTSGEGDPKELGALLSLTAGYARIMGDLDYAEECASKALEIFEGLKKPEFILMMKLRLAVIAQYRKSYIKSGDTFNKAIDYMRKSSNDSIKRHLEFALQNYGVQKFEQGFYRDAFELFSEAHSLRIVKGDVRLVKASEKAMNETRKRLGV